MPYYDSGNVRIYFETAGKSVPLVMLHGFSLDRRMWRRQVEYFAGEYMVIMPDARGHGLSDAPPTDYAREDRVRDLKNLIEHLGINRFHLLGFSMGGGDALAYAIDHPEKLFSLTLAGTAAAGWKPPKRFRDFAAPAREKGVEETRRQYMDSILSHYERRPSYLKDEMHRMILDFSGMPWLDPMKGKYKKRNDINLCSGVQIPTLLIVGQHDIFSRPLAEQLHQWMSNSHLEVIRNAGHMVNMEEPEEFNSIVGKFLRETGNAG